MGSGSHMNKERKAPALTLHVTTTLVLLCLFLYLLKHPRPLEYLQDGRMILPLIFLVEVALLYSASTLIFRSKGIEEEDLKHSKRRWKPR